MPKITKSAENSGKMGRPEYIPRAEDQQKVQILRAQGMSKQAIAVALGIAAHTLNKYFANDLEIAVAARTAAVLMARYHAAIGGNIAAQNKFLELAGMVPPKPKRRVKPARLGKKERATLDAHTADRGTEWEDLLN